MQCIRLAVHDDCMACVVTAVELDNHGDVAAQLVCRFTFAFVAPLGSDNDDARHKPWSFSWGLVTNEVYGLCGRGGELIQNTVRPAQFSTRISSVIDVGFP